MGEWKRLNFEGFDAENCWSGWQRIERMIMEGRTIMTRMGVSEENAKFWEAGGAHAQEAIENSEDDLRRRVLGTSVPSAA
jgi:hypothetical protein